MLLMLVGLQGIPVDVYEAARIDGASRWQTFRTITLPLLRPTLALTTVLCVTGSLLAFEQFYILTKGGPDNSTITVVQLIYSVAFQGQNDLGVAGALSVIVLLALVVINIVQIRAFGGRRTTDERHDHDAVSGRTRDPRPPRSSPGHRGSRPQPADHRRRHRPAHAVLGVHRRRSR